MTWEPRLPLTAAEQHVDWAALNDHIVTRRHTVERRALPAARALAGSVFEHSRASAATIDRLTDALDQQLATTARLGFRHARAELAALRADRPTVAYTVPDAGRYARMSLLGLPGILTLVHERAQAAAVAVAAAATVVYHGHLAEPDSDETLALASAINAARRALHNHVLELVGETLNLGRSAGALTDRRPPEFALRSEQLDKATCDPCSRLHGQIAVVGSNDYWALLPPSGCLGGGRCRGLMVFGDGPMDVRLPEQQAA